MRTEADDSDYMKVPETAAMIRTTPAGLYNMRYRGDGPPAIRLGRRGLLFKRADVERWLSERAEDTRTEQAS